MKPRPHMIPIITPARVTRKPRARRISPRTLVVASLAAFWGGVIAYFLA